MCAEEKCETCIALLSSAIHLYFMFPFFPPTVLLRTSWISLLMRKLFFIVSENVELSVIIPSLWQVHLIRN